MPDAMRANRPPAMPMSSVSISGRPGRTTRTFLIRTSSADSAMLLRVVEDHAEGVALPAGETAHGVAHGGAKVAARALDGAVARGEDQDLALVGVDRLALGLRARALLDQQEVAALVVDAAPAQEAGELEREDDVAVEVLMQTVVAAGLVVEQERRRLRLALLVAARQQAAKIGWMQHRRVEGDLPLIRDGCQRRIGVHPQFLDEPRQRRCEVLVLPDAESVTPHVDATAKARVIRVEGDELRALVRRQQGRRLGVAVLDRKST